MRLLVSSSPNQLLRIAWLPILILLNSCAFAQTLPDSFPDALRLLILEGRDRPQKLAHFRELAKGNGPQLFRDLLALQEGYYRIYDGKGAEPETERALLACLDYYHHKRQREWETLTLVHLSQLYWKTGRPVPAFRCGLRARDSYREWSGAHFPLKYGALYELASKFYYCQDFETAEQLLQEALATTNAQEYIGREQLLNTLGLCARNTGRYQLAASRFAAALTLHAPIEDVWTGIIRGNLGITRFLQGRFAEAIPLLRSDIYLSLRNGAARENAVNSMAYLGDIYLRRHDQAAGRLLDSAWKITCEEHLFRRDYKLLAALYPRLAQLADVRRETAVARDFWMQSSEARDSLLSRGNLLIRAAVQLHGEAELLATSRLVYEGRGRVHALTRNWLLSGILFLAAITLLLTRLAQARRQNRQQLADAEFEMATKHLRSFLASLDNKNQVLKEFQANMEENTNVLSANDVAARISDLRTKTILTKEDWDDFQQLFERMHSGFLNRLSESFPGLTPSNKRYICLLRLGFSAKEISCVLGISPGSVRSISSRLRKRLHLPNNEMLEAFIYRI